MRSISSFLLCIVVLLSGCAVTQPSRFYQFSHTDNSTIESTKRPIALGIGPVTVPEYLKKPQIAKRISEVELSYREFDRWGESLEESIPRFLAEAIATKAPVSDVQTYPFRNSADLDYQVYITINRFEFLSHEGAAALSGRYEIEHLKDHSKTAGGKFNKTLPVTTPSVLAEVSALQELLRLLSEEIAGKL